MGYHLSAVGSEGYTVKKLLYLCAVLIMTFTTVSAFAATDVTGAWVGQFTSADGSVVLDFLCTLKQDGTKLTGSFADPKGSGQSIAITEGKVDGDKIFFKTAVIGIVISHQGMVDGDDIKLTSTSDAESFPGGAMILKRVKPPTPTPAS
jgi:hypothetical protein